MNELREKAIKEKLLKRGFSQEKILNNRGLVGATIDECFELIQSQPINKELEKVKDENEYLKPFRKSWEVLVESESIKIKELEKENITLIESIQWFVDRCEAGEVKSRKTYSKFKELLEKYKK